MKPSLVQRCEMLSGNYNIVKKKFALTAGMMLPVAALTATMKNKLIVPEEIEYCNKLLKKNTGSFSSFRNYVRLPLLIKMAASGDPLSYLENVKTIYEVIQKDSFLSMGNDYRLLGAMTIADRVTPQCGVEAAETANELFRCMKQSHPMITAQDDYPFAAMLSLSGLSADAINSQVEEIFEIVSPAYHSKNLVQTLSQIMALSPRPVQEKCARLYELEGYLKQHGYHFYNNDEAAILGILVLLNADPEPLFDAIREIDEYLKKKKGFGTFSMGKKTRLYYSAQLVINDLASDPDNFTSEGIPETALAIAIDVAITAAIVATAAATAG